MMHKQGILLPAKDEPIGNRYIKAQARKSDRLDSVSHIEVIPKKLRTKFPIFSSEDLVVSPSTSCSSGSIVDHHLDQTSSKTSSLVSVGNHNRIDVLLHGILWEIWNTEKLGDKSSFAKYYYKRFDEVKALACMYFNMYTRHHDIRISDGESTKAAVMAATFLSCKVIDRVPGNQRIKIHRVFEAFGKFVGESDSFGRPIISNESNDLNCTLLERICEIELRMLCLSGFDMQPRIDRCCSS